MFSTHAIAFNSFSDAKHRVDASLLADRLISEIWVDRANVALYAYAGHGTMVAGPPDALADSKSSRRCPPPTPWFRSTGHKSRSR